MRRLLAIACLICMLATGCISSKNRDESVDVDLTVLSSTMLSAELNNITSNPNSYMGRSIRVNGIYYAFSFDDTNQYYHYVLTVYGDDCCWEGLEFILNDNHVYPDYSPEEQMKIEVVGIYSNYEEHGQRYYYLAVDEVAVLN
jgi:hypothetical protein